MMPRPRHRLRRCLLAALVVLTVVAPAAGVTWEHAQLWGGDVRALAFDPAATNRVLAGTASGQIFLSEDGGESWRFPGLEVAFAGWVVSDLVFDPATGGVWAALWGLWGDGGKVYYSPDLGASWEERSDGLPGLQVYRLALDPRRAGRLWAATRIGVFGSEDGGASWRHLTAAHPEIQKVSSLLVDGDTVLAGTWRRAYRSDDGGRTWRGVFTGMVLDSEVFSMSAGPAADEVWGSTCGWVYRSLNGGLSWQRFKRGLDERRTPAITVLPGGRLLAGTVAGLYVSDNGGLDWALRTSTELVIGAITYDPARPQRVLLGTEGSGVWLSSDGGDSFRPVNHGLTAVRVADLVRTGNGEIVAALRHAGPASGIYSSRDGGRTFDGPVELPTVLRLAADGVRPYAATEQGLYERYHGEWRLVAEVGRARVDDVAAGDGVVVARAGRTLFRRAGDAFVRTEVPLAEPRSLAVADGAVWVSDGSTLWRWGDAAGERTEAPLAGGRLEVIAEGVVLAGREGAWLRRSGAGAWEPLLRHATVEVMPTGDRRYPALLLPDLDTARLFERQRHVLREIWLPVPGREVTAALIVDGRLILATSGHGVLSAPVDELVEEGPPPWARITAR